MSETRDWLFGVLTPQLKDITISGARRKGEIRKIKVRPLKLKGELLFQVERFSETQVFHENLSGEQAADCLSPLLGPDYRQVLVRLPGREMTALFSKKGNMQLKTRKTSEDEDAAGRSLDHNRKKHYIIEEGTSVPFMTDLGVMTAEGKIVRTMYDKYRQINRFLEFIEDVTASLPSGRPLTIIDFGCGKSYLTFAMYYYLNVLKGMDARIIGLDLKAAVIRKCSQLAEKYGYDRLIFLCGDIKDYEGVDHVDMVVTLHACDTATDHALAKAAAWGASVILSVPCCQHELNRTMACEPLAGALKYGIIRERTAALMTDAMRAQLLELAGYQTQLLEFIEMEHTPKNILIRAVRSKKLLPASAARQKLEAYLACRQFLGAGITLERLMADRLSGIVTEEKGEADVTT